MVNFNPLTYKPEPLTNTYLKITNRIPFTSSNPHDPIETAALKGIARFISSFVFLRFFSFGGMIYNGAGAVAKGIKGTVELIQGNTQTAQKDMKKALKHSGCFFIDGIGSMSYAAFFFGLFHAISPGNVQRTYELITEFINGKKVSLA